MMRLRMLLPAMLLGLLLALGAFSAACTGDDKDDNGDKAPEATATADSSGDDPTDEPADDTSEPSSDLEEYFQGLDAAENEFRASQDASGAAFAALGDTPAVDDVVELLTELRDVIDEFVANLEDIDPPAEAEAAHEETIAGFQVASDAIGEALDAADSGSTANEVLAVFQAAEVVEAETALDATCNALQQIATDNGIDVDLSCQN